MYTKEQVEQLRDLVAMMKESGVYEFTAGAVTVKFDRMVQIAPELSVDEKLELLKDSLKQQSDDADADLLWSIS